MKIVGFETNGTTNLGVVEDDEKKFLQNLTRYLKISGDQALTIARVMVIKNRG